jgi:hypothetical protein
MTNDNVLLDSRYDLLALGRELLKIYGNGYPSLTGADLLVLAAKFPYSPRLMKPMQYQTFGELRAAYKDADQYPSDDLKIDLALLRHDFPEGDCTIQIYKRILDYRGVIIDPEINQDGP